MKTFYTVFLRADGTETNVAHCNRCDAPDYVSNFKRDGYCRFCGAGE